jgi:hypothetical protein
VGEDVFLPTRRIEFVKERTLVGHVVRLFKPSPVSQKFYVTVEVEASSVRMNELKLDLPVGMDYLVVDEVS